MKKLYSAVVSGNNAINVFDVNKGVKSYTINLSNDIIINGPIITQDKLTIVVKNREGNTRGKVYSLGTGTLSYTFSIK
jgi:hypothetical protein